VNLDVDEVTPPSAAGDQELICGPLRILLSWA
jgi:hypothetical protein